MRFSGLMHFSVAFVIISALILEGQLSGPLSHSLVLHTRREHLAQFTNTSAFCSVCLVIVTFLFFYSNANFQFTAVQWNPKTFILAKTGVRMWTRGLYTQHCP
jgi:hypothetical protein